MTTSVSSVTSSSTGGNSTSKITALQKELAQAQKQLATALKSQDSKVATTKAKMIQVKIAALQAQIAELSKPQSPTIAKSASQENENNAVSAKASSTHNLGNNVDVYA